MVTVPLFDAAGSISARLDRLPATRTIWRLVALLSLGGFFEFYDLFFTGYIAPGLVRSGILTASTHGLFGTTGVASFVAAMFSGLFLGTALFGFVADRFGRRTIFTFSLLWYTVASVVMAFQNDVFGLNLWRFISGIGVGVELVTIDTYLSELVPKELRGRAFAFNQTIQFSSVPVVALLAWLLVPRSPLGLDGWRWVVLIGAAGALFVWWSRRSVPESPRVAAFAVAPANVRPAASARAVCFAAACRRARGGWPSQAGSTRRKPFSPNWRRASRWNPVSYCRIRPRRKYRRRVEASPRSGSRPIADAP